MEKVPGAGVCVSAVERTLGRSIWMRLGSEDLNIQLIVSRYFVHCPGEGGKGGFQSRNERACSQKGS
jgi:hypothetical protein